MGAAMSEFPPGGLTKAVGLHSVVFALLLSIFTIIVLWMPIQTPAADVYIFLPVVFVLYLGIYWLVQRKRSRGADA
jgi:L-asparagine transporter-like permease